MGIKTKPKKQPKVDAKSLKSITKAAASQDPMALVQDGKWFMIKTKAGNLQTLKPNPIQNRILALIQKLQSQNKPIRIWILKARQEGVSTLIQAIIYAYCSQQPNLNASVIADDIDGANYLFNMQKLYHEKMPKYLRPEIEHSNKKELSFKDIHSQILIGTGENLEAGRKYTFQFVHVSEIAFFRKAGELMTGVNQAVPELPGTMIIGETTANGVGGYFYEQWEKAKKGETDWIPLFIPWFENPEYEAKTEAEFSLTEEEQQIKQTYKLTNEKIQWRRNTIKNKCDGSVDTFNQEYPANDREAFLVSGQCRFNTDSLKKIGLIGVSEGKMGKLVDVRGEIVFEPDPNGWVEIWKRPERKDRFVIGSDVAEGLEKGDYSTGEVLRVGTLEQVAELRCHFEPDVFAVELQRLGKYFNYALIGVERNNHGIAVLQALRNIYDELYYMEVFAKETQTRTKKLGWHTNLATKPLMIALADKAIREGIGVIHSAKLLSELMTYVQLADGKTEAQEGCFDDLVVGYAIALQMIKYSHIEPRHKRQDSYADALEQQEVGVGAGYMGA